MIDEHTIIIGAGPCGLSCALELQKHGIKPLIIEKENIVNTIYQFPTHQTFFSTSENLEIGNIPFTTPNHKPVRNEALAYYREVVKRNEIRVNTYERVIDIHQTDDYFQVKTKKQAKIKTYKARYVIIATGYYDQPNYLHIPGENLPKVFHYFKEAHPFYKTNVVVIGGKNSAVDTSLELVKAGANVTVLYRGSTYSKSIKPWILPQFDSYVQKGIIQMKFGAIVKEITPDSVIYRANGEDREIENDFVFAMTGYRPDVDFLRNVGIKIDETTGKPMINKSFETNIENIYVAGVIVSGYNGNETFIENGRFHAVDIVKSILCKE